MKRSSNEKNLDEMAAEDDEIGQQNLSANNPTHEPVHEDVASFRPPPTTSLTPVKTRRESILNAVGSPSSPGLRNRKSLSSADGCHSSFCHEAEHGNGDESNMPKNSQEVEIQSQNTEQAQQQQVRPQTSDTILLTSFWRTYDDVIILSLFSIFGIVFRIFSATWFRMELGVVFSEDSALGTNLPLNCCSCFLLGLLCSGRDAIGIVYSKALGGSNPYGDGRGIFDVGRGAYRQDQGVIDVGRAGFNRARGYGNVQHTAQHLDMADETNMHPQTETSNSFDSEISHTTNHSNSSSAGLHRRRSQVSSHPISIDAAAPGRNRHNSNPDNAPSTISPVSNVSDNVSIAGLLGLDEDFRIGNRQNGEDEVREVQLRALTRRILASPSLVLFPARKADDDVVEHYQTNSSLQTQQSSPDRSSMVIDNHFEIGEPDDDLETAHDEANRTSIEIMNTQNATQIDSDPRRSTSNSFELGEMNIATIQRLYGLNISEGWDIGTSAQEMKYQILLGLRVGFCGAVSTWSSWNSAMISLLQRGKIGEALVGYALGIQLGVVSYRFGQQLAVYIFVFRRRREAKKAEKRGYGLRLTAESIASERPEAETQQHKNPGSILSIRVVATGVFATIILLLFCIIFMFPQHQQFAISLLFTPFGCLGRYKLQKAHNKKLPGFPLGTFTCNLLSVALSGSIGSFLAGNPGPEERIVLTSMIAGFAGSLSTFAGYIAEVLALIDPIIFKFDGFAYAIITVAWGAIIGFFSSQAKNWADKY